jgi:hypothetical protein
MVPDEEDMLGWADWWEGMCDDARQAWAQFKCWLLWHSHRNPNDNRHTPYCNRCGEHIDRHT